MCSFFITSRGCSTTPVERSRVCECWVGPVGSGRHFVRGRGSQHGDFRDGSGVFFSWTDLRCAQSRGLVSMLWSSISKCVPRGQQLSAVFGGGESLGRGGGSGNTPQMFDSAPELGRCFFRFHLRVVKTVSGAFVLPVRVTRMFYHVTR